LEPTQPTAHQPLADGPPAPDAINETIASPPSQVEASRTWFGALAQPRAALPILIALGLILFIANLGGYPLYTKGEPREAVIVLNMVQGGGVILPMRAGVEIPSKPPLMHWMAAALSAAVGRVNEWTVRLPSATLALLGIIVCYLYVRRLFDDRSALLSALMLATTLQYLQAGSGARVDMTLTFFMQVAFFEFLMIAEGLTTRRYLLYLAMAAAVLSKGPVGVVLPGAVAFIWIVIERRFELIGRLKLVQGAAIVCVVAGGWYVAAILVGGASFFVKQILKENIFTFLHSSKLSGGHAHPFYYVELSLLAGFFPWSIFIPGLAILFTRKNYKSNPRIHYLIVWIATVLIFYNVSHSKRGVYLLALYPALAAAVSIFLADTADRSPAKPRWLTPISITAAAFFLIAGLAGLLGVAALKLSPSALGNGLARCGIRAATFMPALADRVHTVPAILVIAAIAGLGVYLMRSRPGLEETVLAVVAGVACLTLAANLFVVPAIADALALKSFAHDAMAIIDGHSVAYLGALNYDFAFYSAKTIPIASNADKDSSDYLLMWSDTYPLLSPASRSNLAVVLKSGPTDLDGSGGMLLLKRAPPTSSPAGTV